MLTVLRPQNINHTKKSAAIRKFCLLLLAGVSRIIKEKVKPFLAEKRHFLPYISRAKWKSDESPGGSQASSHLVSTRPKNNENYKAFRRAGRGIRNKFPVSCAGVYQHQCLG